MATQEQSSIDEDACKAQSNGSSELAAFASDLQDLNASYTSLLDILSTAVRAGETQRAQVEKMCDALDQLVITFIACFFAAWSSPSSQVV